MGTVLPKDDVKEQKEFNDPPKTNLSNLEELKTNQEVVPTPSNYVLEESKQSADELENVSSKEPTIMIEYPIKLVWCSSQKNKVSIIDLETKQNYANFDGVKVERIDSNESWTHVKEIPNTELLVSTHHCWDRSANLEVFDLSQKGQARRIYSFEEAFGVTGRGDLAYNPRRSILSAIPVTGRIAYHLFTINNSSKTDEIVRLNRKSKWPSQFSDEAENYISGFDINPAGESVAMIERYGGCLVSDVDSNNCNFYPCSDGGEDRFSRCRWSTNTDESLLFVKSDLTGLNIFDVDKKTLTLKKPIRLDYFARPGEEEFCITFWIDVCQNDGNLLASGGTDRQIRVFDKREGKIVKSFENVHHDEIHCVRWSPNGDMLASASFDFKVQLLDFKTGKIIHTRISDGYSAQSICFM